MKKILSLALAGTLALSTGVFCPAPGFSTAAEESVENNFTEGTYENVKYNKYADHVEVGDNSENPELTEVVIPAEIDGLPVTEIRGWSFNVCLSLKSVIIPDSVTTIGTGAFCACENLTSVIIPDSVTSIDVASFNGCESLESVVIPDSVTEIGNGAFSGCSNLTSINIPDSVNKIGMMAFQDCKNLRSMTIENLNCEIYDDPYTVCNTYAYGTGEYDENGYEFSGTIYGYSGSTAQAYAEKYGYKFETIGEQSPTETIKGDANGDNSVTIADSVAILQYLANADEYALSEQGLKNADVLGDDGVNTEDALQIQKLDAGVIESL